MPYAITAHSHSHSYTAEQQDVYGDQINDRDYDINLEVESIKTELICTQESLKKISHEKNVLQRERDRAYQKIHHLNEIHQSTISDMLHAEEFLILKNAELLQEVITLKSKKHAIVGMSMSNTQLTTFDNVIDTKNGMVYNQAVRELYYKLLADQIPPAKIESIIKSVLNCFFPTVNTSDLKLPRGKCAGYMRREEMNTICMAQKAYSISESKSLHLNSDRTTKFPKEIGAVSVNGMVLCLNEVPDGSADSMVELVETELEKLRNIAYDLKLKSPEKINWTLLNSMTSDSVSTQKRFN